MRCMRKKPFGRGNAWGWSQRGYGLLRLGNITARGRQRLGVLVDRFAEEEYAPVAGPVGDARLARR